MNEQQTGEVLGREDNPFSEVQYVIYFAVIDEIISPARAEHMDTIQHFLDFLETKKNQLSKYVRE
jgi:hypothetical protein